MPRAKRGGFAVRLFPSRSFCRRNFCRYSPFSRQRLLSFCAQSGKPWLALMPNWVYNKPTFEASLEGTLGAPLPCASARIRPQGCLGKAPERL